MNLHFLRKLPIPKEIKEAYPVAAADAATKESRDRIIRGILEGRDDRFLLVIGPCSADRAEPVLEYLSRLRRLEDETRDRLPDPGFPKCGSPLRRPAGVCIKINTP